MADINGYLPSQDPRKAKASQEEIKDYKKQKNLERYGLKY